MTTNAIAAVADPPTTAPEMIDARLTRILKEDAKRWRGLFMDGGESRWVTLRSEEVALLLRTGAQEAWFATDEYVLKAYEQPVAQLTCDSNGNSHLIAVWQNGKPFTMADKAIKPAAKLEGIDYIKQQVEAALEKRHADRRVQRVAENLTASPEDLEREDAEVALEFIQHVDTVQDNLGKIMLYALWQMRQQGLYLKLPDSPESLTEAIRPMSLRNRDYVLRLAMVVDRIFPEVEALVKRGTPFLHPESGKPITVDDLIVADGLIYKLATSSDHWIRLISLEDKRLLLGAIVTQSALKVNALKEAQQSIQKAPTINVKEEPLADKPGFTRLTMILDQAQLRAVLKLLGPICEVTQ